MIRWLLAASRRQTLASIAAKREATVITLIHRQETLSLLGIPSWPGPPGDASLVTQARKGPASPRALRWSSPTA
jgi:hypothetical protein